MTDSAVSDKDLPQEITLKKSELNQRFNGLKPQKGKSKIYKQHYRKGWEKIPEFKDWICEKEGNSQKVFCKICKKTLHAHKISLIKHTISLKHTKLAQKYTAELEYEQEREEPAEESETPKNCDKNDISCKNSICNDTVKVEIVSNMPDKTSLSPPALVSTKNERPPLTTHVLDTSKGLPAANLSVTLYKLVDGRWTLLNESITNADGRCPDLTSPGSITPGRYKLHFETEQYFALRNTSSFYPFVEVVFDLCSMQEHYHVPLLLSPYGYSTYRGS